MKLTFLKSKLKQTTGIIAICGAIIALPMASEAQSYTITNAASGSMLSAANPTVNYGTMGTFDVASGSLSKGEFDTILKFNTAAAVSQFNTTYGAGDWAITGLTLSLASNFGTNSATPNNNMFNKVSGGNFGIDWLSDNSWVGTSVDYQSETTLLGSPYDALGTFTYAPPGNNVYANYLLPLDGNLVAGAAAGGDVSLYFFPDDNQVNYLFNSQNYIGQVFNSNHPELTLDVSSVPEPATLALLATAFGGLWVARRQKKKS